MKQAALPSKTDVIESYLLPMTTYVDSFYATFEAFPRFFMDFSGGAAACYRAFGYTGGQNTLNAWLADIRESKAKLLLFSSNFSRLKTLQRWAALTHNPKPGPSKRKKTKRKTIADSDEDSTPFHLWTHSVVRFANTIDSLTWNIYEFEKKAATSKSTSRKSPLGKIFMECVGSFSEARVHIGQLRMNLNSLLTWVVDTPARIDLTLDENGKQCIQFLGTLHPVQQRFIDAMRELGQGGEIRNFHAPTLSEIHKLDSRLKKLIFRSPTAKKYADSNYTTVISKDVQIFDWIPPSRTVSAKKSSSKK